MRRANAKIYEMSRARVGQKGMGTTCVTAVIGNGSLSVAHVGDSRAYLLRDGILRRLTEDHSYIQDQVRQGQLSDHDARVSRFKHVITRALGIEATVKPDFHSHDLVEGDIVLLCSDGLSGVVDEAGMIQILSRTLNAQAASDYLVDSAKRQGSKDNISSVVARYGGEPEPPLPPDLTKHDSALSKPIVKPIALPAGTGTFVAAMLLGALLTLLVLAALTGKGFRLNVTAPPTVNHVSNTSQSGSSLAGPSSYSPPRVLLDRNVIGDVIAGSDAGVIVAEADTGDLWSVNTLGQVRNVGQITASGPSRGHDQASHYLATDEMGRTYVSSPDDGVIKRFSPDGHFERTIADGLLKDPQALWVAKNGDIYVIDSHRLNLISVQASSTAIVGGTTTHGASGAGAAKSGLTTNNGAPGSH